MPEWEKGPEGGDDAVEAQEPHSPLLRVTMHQDLPLDLEPRCNFRPSRWSPSRSLHQVSHAVALCRNPNPNSKLLSRSPLARKLLLVNLSGLHK